MLEIGGYRFDFTECGGEGAAAVRLRQLTANDTVSIKWLEKANCSVYTTELGGGEGEEGGGGGCQFVRFLVSNGAISTDKPV